MHVPSSLGKEVAITAKEGQSTGDSVEITKGMRFDNPHPTMDVKTSLGAAYIFLQDILPSLEAAVRAGAPKVTIVEDVDDGPLVNCKSQRSRFPVSETEPIPRRFGISHWWQSSTSLMSNSSKPSTTITKGDTIDLDVGRSKGSIRGRCEQVRRIIPDPTV